MSVYISGGCKNGKSYHAQRVARDLGAPLYYVATMIPSDEEDQARIRRHIDERAGWGFETVECGTDILRAFEKAEPSGSFLIDSVTALLANEMFRRDGTIDETAHLRIADQLAQFIEIAPKTVLVSDFIFSDAAIYSELVEDYRRGLAYIDRHLAKRCGAVIEVINGSMIYHKGGPECFKR